ncbi:hypothetical protein KDW_44770 [Dictyobacter vulcani]|uniref:Uncharacterized protein n=1 Tax=Dictyobacter vulcani TaxID=2607529 RepID=A0A5J4KR05_9CHLR|nr:hypothetical protein [Dictyobacter vulcani]GER90315.1 hypothetical protein KDW_44770 [Dictyobacter vulcani]
MQDHPNSQLPEIEQEELRPEDEGEVAEVFPTRKLKPLTMLLWVLIVLVVIGFAIFGVTTLQHHAPTPPDNTQGAIEHAIVLASLLFMH